MAESIKLEDLRAFAKLNGLELRPVKGGLMIGSGLDAIFIRGEGLKITDPTEKVRGHYPDMYPWAAPHEHPFDDITQDTLFDRSYPYDGIPLELIPKVLRELKNLLLGNVSIKANFPVDEITGEYKGPLQKGDLVTWDTETGAWVAATCPKGRGLTDSALFTGVAFPDSDEILSAANVICDAWKLTPGQSYYLDCANPGKMTEVDTGYYVGVAQSPTAMYFAPYAASVEQVITNIQAQVSEIDAAMKELDEAFDGVQTTVSDMQAIVEQVKENDDAVTGRLNNITQALNSSHEQLVDALARVGQLEATDATHTTYFNNISSQFSTLTSTITNLSNSLSASDEEIRVNIREVQKAIDAINEVIGSGTTKWAELVEKHDKDIADIMEILGDCTCESIKTTLSEHASKITALEEADASFTANMNGHLAEFATLKEGHNILYGQVQELNTSISDTKEDVERLSTRVATNERAISELHLADVTFQGALDAANGLIATNISGIAENKNTLATLRNDITAAFVEVEKSQEAQNAKIQANTEGIALNTTGLEDAGKSIATVSQRVLAIENMIADGLESECTCDVAAITASIAEVAVKADANTAAISSLDGRIEGVENIVGDESLMGDVTQLKADVAAIQTLDTQQSSAITNLQTQVTNLVSADETHNAALTSLSSSIGGLSSGLEALNTRQTTLETKVDEIVEGGGSGGGGDSELAAKVAALEDRATANEAVIASNKTTAEGAAAAANTNTSAITALDGRVTALEGATPSTPDLSAITGRLTALEEADEAQDSLISANTSGVESLDARVTALEAGGGGGGDGENIDLTPITTRLTAVESKNTEQDNAISGLSGWKTTTEAKLNNIEAEQTSDKTRLETLESFKTSSTETLSELEGCCSSTQASISELQSKVDGLEGDVTDLEGQLSTVSGSLDALEEIVGSGGGTTSKVVTAPEFTLPNFIVGETVSISFSSSSLLTDGSVASFKVKIPALSVDETVTATDGAASLEVTVPNTVTDGTVIAVTAYAVDSLGNISETTSKSGTAKVKAIATPTITVSGQEDIWASGLTVTPSEFSMQVGTDTLAGATVTIRNSADSSTFATKEFTGAGPYVVPVSELTNIYGGGAFKVKMVYTSTGGLTSPEAVADVTVTGAAITTPTLTSPVANAEILKTGSLIMTSSAFAKTPANAPIVHSLTDWKVTSDAAGNVPVLEAMNSTDLTSHTFSNLSSLADNTTYYCWVRFHGTL